MRLALGTAQLGMAYGVANRRGMLDADDARRLLHIAVEHGVLVWDTAPGYGCAEQRIGDFVRQHGRPDGLELVTKISRLPAALPDAAVAAHIVGSVEASRRALGVDRLAAVLLHHSADATRPALDALAACRDRGWIERVGVSFYEVSDASLDERNIDAAQVPFNVFNRAAPVAAMRERGWRTFARSALAQGAILLPPSAAPIVLEPWLNRLRRVCAERDVPLFDAALGFALHRSGADHIVLGVDDCDQLTAAVQVARRGGPGDVGLYDAIEQQLVGAEPAADPRTWT